MPVPHGVRELFAFPKKDSLRPKELGKKIGRAAEPASGEDYADGRGGSAQELVSEFGDRLYGRRILRVLALHNSAEPGGVDDPVDLLDGLVALGHPEGVLDVRVLQLERAENQVLECLSRLPVRRLSGFDLTPKLA